MGKFNLIHTEVPFVSEYDFICQWLMKLSCVWVSYKLVLPVVCLPCCHLLISQFGWLGRFIFVSLSPTQV